jgi:hypothetical protein
MGNRSGFFAACLLIFLASCFLCLPAWGQQLQGRIAEVVTDPSSSLIPDEQGTGFSRSSRTLQDGAHDISLLPPGRNHVGAAKGGFETLSQGPITLLVNAHLKIDFLMSAGAQATTCLFVVQIEQKCGVYGEFNCIC